jgi:cell division protease FtsH
MTRPELVDKLTVLMGGRAAEQVVFGVISTGSSDDLVRATDLARRMVTQFGMSDELGPQSVARPGGLQEAPFLPGVVAPPDRISSERTLELIDREVRELLGRAFARALQVLAYNRVQLIELAARLREREVLEGTELRGVLEHARLPPDLDVREQPPVRH